VCNGGKGIDGIGETEDIGVTDGIGGMGTGIDTVPGGIKAGDKE
jgi:hypothetical protein